MVKPAMAFANTVPPMASMPPAQAQQPRAGTTARAYGILAAHEAATAYPARTRAGTATGTRAQVFSAATKAKR